MIFIKKYFDVLSSNSHQNFLLIGIKLIDIAFILIKSLMCTLQTLIFVTHKQSVNPSRLIELKREKWR